MPIVFAFCRSAPSVRFIAFATCATGVLAFEWALSSRKSSLVHSLRTGAFLFGIRCSSLPAGQLNYLYSVRARPTTSGRQIRPGPNAKSDGIGTIGFGAKVARFIWRASVDVIRNSAFYASARSRPCSWASATGSKTMPREGVCPDLTSPKHCAAKSPRRAFTAAPRHDRGDEVHNAGQLQAPRRTRHR